MLVVKLQLFSVLFCLSVAYFAISSLSCINYITWSLLQTYEQERKEREELDKMLEENRRRVEEAQRREALERQQKELERYLELEQIQKEKEEAMRRKKMEEEEEKANQMKLLGKNKSRPKLSFGIGLK